MSEATGHPGATPGTDAAATAASDDYEFERTHATDAAVAAVVPMFRVKSTQDVEGTMTHFHRPRLTYTDSTFNILVPSWQVLHDYFAGLFPTIPADAISYPTRIIGDEHSAVVIFTDTPHLFGQEIRIVAAVDFEEGRVTRQVDYSDGRHYGLTAADEFRQSEPLPEQLGEQWVRNSPPPALTTAIDRLRSALATADGDAIAALFSPDGVFVDHPLHLSITGPIAIRRLLFGLAPLLPYAQDTHVRHVVGAAAGGGYEWTKPGAAVDRGIVAVELDGRGLIRRLTAMWDGSQVSDADLLRMLGATLEG